MRSRIHTKTNLDVTPQAQSSRPGRRRAPSAWRPSCRRWWPGFLLWRNKDILFPPFCRLLWFARRGTLLHERSSQRRRQMASLSGPQSTDISEGAKIHNPKTFHLPYFAIYRPFPPLPTKRIIALKTTSNCWRIWSKKHTQRFTKPLPAQQSV